MMVVMDGNDGTVENDDDIKSNSNNNDRRI